jgi:hypothetical protein
VDLREARSLRSVHRPGSGSIYYLPDVVACEVVTITIVL